MHIYRTRLKTKGNSKKCGAWPILFSTADLIIWFATPNMRGSRGGRGQGVRNPPPPTHTHTHTHLKNYQNIIVLAILTRTSEKTTKLPCQLLMLGQHQHANETPFKWRFAGGPILARLEWYLDSLSPHQLKKKEEKLDPI